MATPLGGGFVGTFLLLEPLAATPARAAERRISLLLTRRAGISLTDYHTKAAAAIRRDVCADESSAEADAVGRAMVETGYRGFDPKAFVRGSITEVAKKLRALVPVGHTDIVDRHATGDHAMVLGALARLAETRPAPQNAWLPQRLREPRRPAATRAS